MPSSCCGFQRRGTMKIAVFCPNLIGDTVMATPAFRALRRGFPEAMLALVVKPRVWPTLEGTTWFDEVINFEPGSMDRERRTLPVLRRLRRARFDVAVLFPNSIRSASIAWLADIPRRVGYVRHGRGLLLSDRLHYPRDSAGRRLPTPIVESYLKLVRVLGCPVESVRAELGDDRRRRGRGRRRMVGAWPGIRQAGRLSQYGRRVWPRQELANQPFRRAGAATCRRGRCCRPGSLRAGRTRCGAGDCAFGLPSASGQSGGSIAGNRPDQGVRAPVVRS